VRSSAPIGFDAGAIAFYLDAAFALTLDLETLVKIFDGEITNWSDPVFQQLNPEVEFEDLEIQVLSSAPQAAITALQTWAQQKGISTSLELLSPDEEGDWSGLLAEFENGAIGLMPYSLVSLEGGAYASIATSDASGAVVELSPTPQSIYVASTKWRAVVDGEFLLAEYDSAAQALPFPGTESAGEPYQLVYPIYLDLCGSENLLQTSMARYLARLDAQGLMATSTLGALPEEIRVQSAVHLGRGLPEVEVDPDSLGG
jgi:ABC-type phosphate transport system substrate-binding protein